MALSVGCVRFEHVIEDRVHGLVADIESEHYFLVAADRAALRLGHGPEALVDSASDRYLPMWVPLSEVRDLDLRPASIRADLVRWGSAEGA